MKKPGKRLIWAGVFALITAGTVALALLLPDFWFSFYTDFSHYSIYFLGTVLSLCPVPVWEILLVLLVLTMIGCLVWAVRKHRIPGFLAMLLEINLLGVMLFMLLWGLNHFAPPIGEQINLNVRKYSATQLEQAAAWYAEQASALSTQVKRDAGGEVVPPSISEQSETAVAAYKLLGAENSRFKRFAPVVKPLMGSTLFAEMGTTGIYLCLTGEAAVSTKTYGLTQPFTVCHELGHSLAVAREDEANYLAFLACRASEDELFRYSGYYCAFLYCYNAINEENPDVAAGLWEHCSEQMRQDSNRHVSHDKQFEGSLRDTAQSVNDTYLKTFNEAGVKSYGLVVDYLVTEYLMNH